MQKTSSLFPDLGFGLGLRIPHYTQIFEHKPKVDWFEIISENFMDTGGRPRRNLDRIRADYPIVMHGIAMSIGTIDPLNSDYLSKLKTLVNEVEPAWISDHLCWTGIAHKNTHDLLPVPYTEEALDHIVSRIIQVQDFLGREIALENPSTYLEFKTSHIPEAEFIAQMAARSGCNLLLDINNVFVSCFNHRLDAKAYLDALPLDKVIQIHLSGHSNMGTHIIDTHDDHVVDEVWQLYKYVVHKAGRTPNTMVEWDDNIPTWDVLVAELGKAKIAANAAASFAPLPDLKSNETPYVANAITPLDAAQNRLQQAIFAGNTSSDNPADWIRAKADFSPAAQLEVYANAYRFRLHDVTAEDYPVLQHYLGDDAFHSLIHGFVDRTQSKHFNVARYAAQLPHFIAQHKPTDLFAHEIAALETAISQLADKAETIALTQEHLAGLTPDTLMETVLHPRQALQLFAFTYPVNDYYLAVMEEKNSISPSPAASYLAVFRHEDVVWRMGLGEHEYHLLQLLFSGLPIGDALERLQVEHHLPDEVLTTALTDWFSRWIRNGLLASNAASALPTA